MAIESAEAALAKAAARELAARSKRPRRRYRAMTDDEESSSDDGEAVLGDSRDEADSAGDDLRSATHSTKKLNFRFGQKRADRMLGSYLEVL